VSDHPQIDDIVSAVCAGKCVLFLGTGVHAPAPPGSPWDYPAAAAPPFGGDLSQKLADESGYLKDYPGSNPRELARVAMHYELKPGKGRQALVRKVRAEVEVGKRPSPVLRALAELNFPLVITTNYDSFFEKSLPANKQPDIRIYEPKPNYDWSSDFAGDLTGMTPGVCKIHGDFSQPESLVITDEDYIQFVLRMRDDDNIHPFPFTARFLMRRYPTLFVGYSLLDYNLRLFIKTLRMRLDPANFPASYSVDPSPDKMVRTVWQDQRRWVWFVPEGAWSFVPALYKAATGRDMPS
jgi:SIR2-like domain